jgi:catechol 2,3-dioxygenase-like lactoylglutathione lyase family enzyme
MLDHFGIQCSDLAASATFYDAVLAPLGASRLMDFEVAIGYGITKPDFWIGVFDSGDGFRESHIAFAAKDRAAVRAFFDTAVAAGAEVLHEPRVWPEYHPDYYGAFVRDPDGNNVEAVCHTPEPARCWEYQGGSAVARRSFATFSPLTSSTSRMSWRYRYCSDAVFACRTASRDSISATPPGDHLVAERSQPRDLHAPIGRRRAPTAT